MYQKGNMVVYGMHGVCKILGLEVRRVDRNSVEYYVLEPLKHSCDRYYVPTQNAAAVSKMKPLLNKEQLDTLLSSHESALDVWIEDENQRKQRYRELITGGDRVALLSMVKALHMHKDAQLAQGRRLHLCDENFLRDAENLLGGEISLVLGIAPEEVGGYIQNAIQNEMCARW